MIDPASRADPITSNPVRDAFLGLSAAASDGASLAVMEGADPPASRTLELQPEQRSEAPPHQQRVCASQLYTCL